MKKHLSIILALVLVFVLSVSAGAGTIEDTPGTGTTAVEYVVAQEFTVTIPEKVELQSGTPAGTNTGDVSVTGAIIEFGKNLTVTITNATNYGGSPAGFRLLDDGTTDNYLSYTIENEGVSVLKDTAFLTVPAGTATGSVTLTFTASPPTKSGTYTDTLTFTVAIVDQ